MFIGFAPYDEPRYAISVVIENGEWGGSVAGPVARDIMEATLTDDPTRFIPKNPIKKPLI